MQDKTITLSEPITIAGKTITQLTVHKPKAKILRGIKFSYDGIDGDTLLDIAAKLTGELPAVIDELGAEDIMNLVNAASDFFPQLKTMAGKQQSAI